MQLIYTYEYEYEHVAEGGGGCTARNTDTGGSVERPLPYSTSSALPLRQTSTLRT